MSVYKNNKPPNAIQFIASRDSIRPESSNDLISKASFNLHDAGYFLFDVESPKNFEGRTVLVFHGDENNTIPNQSREAYETHGDEADLIFCCFPKQVTRLLGDKKIQWKTVDVPLEAYIYETGDKLIITIRETRR